MDSKVLEEKAQAMQAEIKQAEEEMGGFSAVGKSADGSVQVEMDACHQVKSIAVKEGSWERMDQVKFCGCMAEAINNAVDQVDNEVELKMSSIVYKYTTEMVKEEGKNSDR